jgi:hypothetical protein
VLKIQLVGDLSLLERVSPILFEHSMVFDLIDFTECAELAHTRHTNRITVTQSFSPQVTHTKWLDLARLTEYENKSSSSESLVNSAHQIILASASPVCLKHASVLIAVFGLFQVAQLQG